LKLEQNSTGQTDICPSYAVAGHFPNAPVESFAIHLHLRFSVNFLVSPSQ